MYDGGPAPSRFNRARDDLERSVLPVDDSSHFLRDATSSLRSQGVSVVGRFEDAAVALAQVSVLAPGVALVDLRIRGGLPGLAFIPRLRAIMPRLGLVALSLSHGHRRAALAAGADEFVDKAAFATELLPAIRGAAGAAAGRQQDLRPTSGDAEATPCPR